jgi:two-component system, LytTR family, response regulator
MKALLVDDERLARAELRRLLAAHPSVEIIGEADNGNAALDLIGQTKPDLVFLDIQMPGKNGFEVLQALQDPKPQIIFTTAYDQYALKAFEFSAADYLLKPVDPKRLEQAIDKLSAPQELPVVDAQAEEEAEEDFESAPQPANNREKVLGPEDHVFIKDGEKFYYLRLGQVRIFESIGNYVRLHSDQGKPMILRSLNALEERLDSAHFFRANRKHMVNLQKVEHVEPYFSGGLLLKMNGGDKIEVSRRQAAKFKELLSL